MITLHFGGYQPPRSVHTRALHVLREAAAQRSGGELGITVTENVVAGGRKAADLLTMVETGELDGCYFASSYLAGRVSALTVLDLPFYAPPRQQLFPALDHNLGALLSESIDRSSGFSVLGYWDNGLRHISNAVRTIRHPGDCQGLSIRTLDNALHQAAFRALGFRPMFIDVADLPRAVADRTVEAQENPLTNVVNFGLQAHHPHVSLTGHLSGVALLLANRRRIAALPSDVRSLLDQCLRDSEAAQREFAAAEDSACEQSLRAEGIVPVQPEDIDTAAFRGAVAHVVEPALRAVRPELRYAMQSAGGTQ